MGFRGPVGFCFGAIVCLVVSLFNSSQSNLVPTILMVSLFAAAGLIGAMISGLGVRGTLGFGLGFLLLLPPYVLAAMAPFAGSWVDALCSAIVCIAGFAVAGWSGAWISRPSRAIDGAIAFAIGGAVGACLWHFFPGLRSEGISVQLFGPWQVERLGLLRVQALASLGTVSSNSWAVLPIGAGIGGLLFGIRVADRSVSFGLTPTRSWAGRVAGSVRLRHWVGGIAAILIAAGVFWSASLTDRYQRRVAASRLAAAILGPPFDSLRIGSQDGDPYVFRVVLRARSDMDAVGRKKMAAQLSERSSRYASEYAGHPDEFSNVRCGLAAVTMAFVETGAKEYLRGLLENAEHHADVSVDERNRISSRADRLLAVATGWAIYGDRGRFQSALIQAVGAAKGRK